MLKISLYTSGGELVTDVLVPPFKVYPEAIIWGSRIFFYKEHQFREGFAYVAFTETEMKNLRLA